ncbi:MAG TPA: L-aspartate oxidase [Bacteroidales bacterium]|jgi:L-aspartate oxidase|nr:L-aspartate oxidase [Bacteroidales bacterium]HNZ42123.1 L-aspartate oxidase [Bacteroidales bacterium]HPB24336.1 L-aspartate oxidase [Bacteroidales bacterium]HPI29003.1 L-aspartate oxidase [Bacteroidales bacterium]HQN15321.1 L-aspartate oxidase [Bacteroidales bacterium]
MRKEVDFLIIGSGIAGLSYALRVASKGSVCIVTKSQAKESSTNYAQGGIAAVMYDPDSYEKHIKDTLIAGAGLCDENIVRITISESTERIKELISWGTEFDKTASGKYDLAKEGGHSEHRVLHNKDHTGASIEKALLNEVKRHKNIEILENHFAIDLITEHHLGMETNRKSDDIKCYGAYVLNPAENSIITILSKITLLATGGAGNVYSNTTNPTVATGDGVAMVFRAKGEIKDMEFFQFHPTSLYNPKERPSFLISEAVRGFGGILKTIKGNEFMQKYDPRLSLAPRDIVARAIDTEMKISGDEHVCLDCRHLDSNKLIEHFPTIYAKCLSIGIDITKEMIPVVPAAHFLCGGIQTDEYGRTSIKNLYATGECACTGLHGANRLASNSLLESVVFSHRAALDALEKFSTIGLNTGIPDWNAEGTVLNEEMILITQTTRELREIMSNYVGIVRSNLRLKRAMDRLDILYHETEKLYDQSVLTVEICELRNMINVAFLIISMAQERKESRGLHYSLDYPDYKK